MRNFIVFVGYYLKMFEPHMFTSKINIKYVATELIIRCNRRTLQWDGVNFCFLNRCLVAVCIN